MSTSQINCDLCSLPLRHDGYSSTYRKKKFRFCCRGCQQVFQLLMESTDRINPSSFQETEIFRKCQEMGIIPRTEQDLKDKTDPPGKKSLEKEAGPVSSHISPVHRLPVNLSIRDMWCPACAWVIKEALKKMDGIGQVRCDFLTDMFRCTYDPSMTSPERIIEAIRHLGYDAGMSEIAHVSRDNQREFVRFAISAFFTVNIMMLSFALYTGFFTSLTVDETKKLSWPIFIMTTIVLGYGGAKIFRRCLRVTRTGAGMETLIATGSFCAYAYSTFNMLSGSLHLYFDIAAMLIVLFLLGKRLERWAKDSIQKNLGRLSSLQPSKVRLVTDQFPEGRYVSIQQLKKGRLFIVTKHDVVAADGMVVSGEGSVDESSLTGEAIPLKKRMGDRLRAGTKVLQGSFTLKADGIGEHSTLGQMIHIMEKAMESRTRLEGKTDQALQWFVPSIIGLAVATGLACRLFGLSTDEAILRAMTVTVISCPCAIGIAIPLARVAGFALSRKRGILVHEFSAFGFANQCDTFVFDKTGTVTTGQWSLIRVIPFEPFTEEKALAMAAGLEMDSDHYIAAVLRAEAKKRGIQPVSVSHRKTTVSGISGRLHHRDTRIGSKSFLEVALSSSETIALDGPVSRLPQSNVYLGYDGRLCAVFVFGDHIKEGASQVVNRLKAKGHRTILVSGDGVETTHSVSEHVGFDSAYGAKLPLEKVDIVKHLQNTGHCVCVVGDGINDAPALAQADLAVAIHSGNYLTEEAADVTLMRGNPLQLLDLLGLGKRVNQKIGQNLTLSIVYNALSIPVAMMGLLNPLIAVCAMFLSSLSVIGNTLLLIKSSLSPKSLHAALREV